MLGGPCINDISPSPLVCIWDIWVLVKERDGETNGESAITTGVGENGATGSEFETRVCE